MIRVQGGKAVSVCGENPREEAAATKRPDIHRSLAEERAPGGNSQGIFGAQTRMGISMFLPSCHGLPQPSWAAGSPPGPGVSLQPLGILTPSRYFTYLLSSPPFHMHIKKQLRFHTPALHSCLHPLSLDTPPSEPRGWKVGSTVGVSAVPPHSLPSNATQREWLVWHPSGQFRKTSLS